MVKDHDGKRLAKLMQRAKVTDAKLAAATGASVQAVGKWKRLGVIARERIPAICAKLNCSSDELLGLVPIRSVGEEPAHYHTGMEPARLRRAIGIIERTIVLPKVTLPHDGLADFVFDLYNVLEGAPSDTAVEQFVHNALRAISKGDPTREPQ